MEYNIMNKSTEEVLNRGMTYLREKMGTVDAEYFIYLVIKEQFDYTEWQREYFDNKSPNGFTKKQQN